MNETRSETAIANAIVMPKLYKKRPTIPCMKASGTKITSSESVVATTARRDLARCPRLRRSIGVSPFSSMCRKMFSITMIASSITMPIGERQREQRQVVQREAHGIASARRSR